MEDIIKNEPSIIEYKYLNNNKIEAILEYKVNIDYNMMKRGVFRNLLEEAIRNKYYKRAYFIFYILDIDFSPIREKKLHLLKFNQGDEEYVIRLNSKLLFITKDQELECLILINDENNIIGLMDDYLICRILTSFNIENFQRNIQVKLQNGKIIKNNTKHLVKITNIYSSNLGESDRIICDAEFIIN